MKKKSTVKRRAKREDKTLISVFVAVALLLLALFLLKEYLYAPSPTQETTIEAGDTLGITTKGNDTISPKITLLSPKNGSRIRRYGLLTLSANAQDNVRVSKVEFYLNKELMCEDTTPTFGCSMRVSGRKGIRYIVDAVAFDMSGNIATSSAAVISQ